MLKLFSKFFYITISIFIIFFIGGYKNIEKKVYKLSVKNIAEHIEIKLKGLSKDIKAEDFDKENLEIIKKLYYVESKLTIYSTIKEDIGKTTQLKAVPENKEKGYCFYSKDMMEYYYPTRKGILVAEYDTSFHYILAKKIFLYVLMIILLLLLASSIIYFVFYMYNFYSPMLRIKKHLKSFDEGIELSKFDKKISSQNSGDLIFIITILNNFFDKVKKKMTLLEFDRKAMKQVYEKMKFKNSQIISLYEFSKNLYPEKELLQIFHKIKKIVYGKMYSNVLIIILKNEKGIYETAYLEGVKTYKNLVEENSIERAVENLKKSIRIRDTESDNRVDLSSMELEDREKLSELIISPLKFEDKVTGFFIVDKVFNSKLKPEEETSTVTSIGEILGDVIGRFERHKNINMALNLTSILYSISKLSEKNLTFDQAHDSILNLAKRLINYTYASIYLVRNGLIDERPVKEKFEKNKIVDQKSFDIIKKINLISLKNKELIMINNINNEPYEKVYINSFASVPILYENGDVLGIINFLHQDKNKFEEKDKKILKTFVKQCRETLMKIAYDSQLR